VKKAELRILGLDVLCGGYRDIVSDPLADCILRKVLCPIRLAVAVHNLKIILPMFQASVLPDHLEILPGAMPADANTPHDA
jgi:hypothetical protein